MHVGCALFACWLISTIYLSAQYQSLGYAHQQTAELAGACIRVSRVTARILRYTVCQRLFVSIFVLEQCRPLM
jgi:hypothetical protein